MTRFSVIIATVGRHQVLPRAVRSVLDQDLDDLELVVVADGSGEATRACLEPFDDPRLRILDQEHKGVSAARNAGAAGSTGDYLVFLDDDDTLFPDCLSGFAASIETTGATVISGSTLEVDLEGNVLQHRSPTVRGSLFHHQRFLALSGAFTVRRDVFESVGGYAEGLRQSENHELFLRLCQGAVADGWTFACVEQPCMTRYIDHDRASTKARAAARFEAAGYYLEHHGEALSAIPEHRARYLRLRAVSAAQLGELVEARRCFRAAVRAEPLDIKAWAHLSMAAITPFARWYWSPRRAPTLP